MRETAPPLFTAADLHGFFQERVEEAVRHQRAPIRPETGCYLTALLVEQGRREEGPGPQTLVEMQAEAIAAPATRAAPMWRRMGDHALIISGLFQEHIERRRLSRAYYEEMGAAAYARLGRLFRAFEARQAEIGGMGDTFAELSDRFHACVAVLQEVREEAAPCSDDDVLRLYERYLQGGSPRIAERLQRLGVVPVRLRAEE